MNAVAYIPFRAKLEPEANAKTREPGSPEEVSLDPSQDPGEKPAADEHAGTRQIHNPACVFQGPVGKDTKWESRHAADRCAVSVPAEQRELEGQPFPVTAGLMATWGAGGRTPIPGSRRGPGGRLTLLCPRGWDWAP